jgi:hypothetical protein
MDVHRQTVSQDGHLALLFCHRVQFLKLALFLIVVDGRHRGADEDSYQNGEALDPSLRPLLLWSCAHLQDYRQDGCHQQNPQREIFKRLAEKFD